MDQLIRNLPGDAVVLDLGAGGGSFEYDSSPARVLALDVDFPSAAQAAAGRLLANSGAVPLRDASVDVVVCNHTLEHFESLAEAIIEVDRVLKPGGALWAAVPDGFCFDDRLYRYVFHGGGHVNRFSLKSFLAAVESPTRLRAERGKRLYTGFVYLQPPDPGKLPHFPPRARRLARYPEWLLESVQRWMNFAARWADKVLGTRLSRYGWGIVFRRGPDACAPLSEAGRIPMSASDFNVCFTCGSGHPSDKLRQRLERHWLFFKTYECANCGQRNLWVPPPTKVEESKSRRVEESES